MKKIAAICALALICTGRALAYDTICDCQEWHRFDSNSDNYIAKAANSSMQIGLIEGFVQGAMAIGMLDRGNEAITWSKTWGAYIALVDDFYERHQNARTAPLYSIMLCLADKPKPTCEQVASTYAK
jgi:hypothetical protein